TPSLTIFKMNNFDLFDQRSHNATIDNKLFADFIPVCFSARSQSMNKGLRNELLALFGIGALACFAARRNRAGAILSIAAGVLTLFASKNKDNFHERTVVITGGSRGLGLALAKELVKEGARVALLARDTKELDRAKSLIRFEKPDAQIITLI